jgi:uracil-DNA glycosylase family 4
VPQIGLFTRVELKQAGTRSTRKNQDVSLDTIRQLGVRAVADMNPSARTPNMRSTGSKKPKVYVLGEAPGQRDDREGRQFLDDSGRLLRAAIPDGHEGRVRWDNCVRTRPPKNRSPVPVEVEAFRSSVVRDIEKYKPDAILAVGKTPLNWLVPGSQVKPSRGRRFPVSVGAHTCWAYASLDPQYVLRVKDAYKEDDAPGSEWVRTFKADVARVFDDIEQGLPPAKVEPADKLERGIQNVLTLSDLRDAVSSVLLAGEGFSFDFEARGERPYAEGAKVLSLSFGSGRAFYAVPIDHEEAPWSRGERAEVLRLLRKLFKTKADKVAHNLGFDLEWLVWLLDDPDLLLRPRWHCTMAQAFVLDPRQGGLSLDYLCSVHFGLPLKSFSESKLWLESTGALNKLLRYNGIDAKYTWKLFVRQTRLLRHDDLLETYERFRPRVRTLVGAQRLGIPVRRRTVRKLSRRLRRQQRQVEGRIGRRREVRKFERRYKTPFSVSSTDDVRRMFQDVLGRTEGEREGRYTTDEEALKAMPDEPLAELVLKYRELAKIQSTYLLPLDQERKGSVVFPDGKLHPRFKYSRTITSRLASEDPNVQNFPKRENAWVRQVIEAPVGWSVLACDEGQIEARIIGMASKDKFLVDSLWTGYDIHLHWAEKLVKAYPALYRRFGKDIKKVRQDVKNTMVFPSFYGSAMQSVARNLQMPESIARPVFEEFWDDFAGVRRWQGRLRQFYRKHGYVEDFFGLRRRAPMSDNALINFPIQATAAWLVMEAMTRISDIALKLGLDWLHPILQIHDDLTFLVPTKKIEKALEYIVPEMLRTKYDWINVPLTLEVASGPNWFELKELGKYTSTNHR